MTNVAEIINRYRGNMEAAGHLRSVGKAQVSETVQAMRPSLAKVQAGLAERPDRFAVVQPSPMIVLFETTLPAIEHILVGLGEERAKQIISALCEHGQKMIAQYGIDGAREHLEELFNDLPRYEKEIRGDQGVERIIETYRQLNFEGRGEAYLKLKLGDKIERMKVREDGLIMLVIILDEEANQADLACFEKVANICGLCLRGADDEGLRQIRGLSKLEFLNIEKGRVTDAGLAHLAGMTKLQQLEITENQITGEGLGCLSGLSRLAELDLHGNAITDDKLAHLSGLTGLLSLDLRDNAFERCGLEHLSGLTGLRLLKVKGQCINNIQVDISPLRGLVNLEVLDLIEMNITDANLLALRDMAKLCQLNLAGNWHLSGAGLVAALGQLAGLKFLNLAGLSLRAADLQELVALSQVETLSLSGTPINDDGLSHLGRMTGLRGLSLGDTSITDAGLEKLLTLTNLERLLLAQTGLTDACVPHLKKMSGLKMIHLASTNISREGAEELRRAFPDAEILLDW